MSFMTKIFAGKTAPVTSTMIRDEIARAEGEIIALRVKLGGALTGVAAMSDSEHVQIQGEIAGIERAITRLEARVAYLNTELPTVIAAGEAAAKVAADESLRQRAEAARKANTKEAAALLHQYDKLAAQIAEIFARLDEIAAETNAVNNELRLSPVAGSVELYDSIHRKHLDRLASERRDTRMCWVYDDGFVIQAEIDSAGNPKRPEPKWVYHAQKYAEPRLETRQVVVGRTDFRSGHYEASLNAVRLPPGFVGGEFHWPRK